MWRKINLKKIGISIIAILTLLTSMGNSFINVYAEGEETSTENSDSSTDTDASETNGGGQKKEHL